MDKYGFMEIRISGRKGGGKMKFLTLTRMLVVRVGEPAQDIKTDGKTRVNFSSVKWYAENSIGTSIHLASGSIWVKETPEQIDEMLKHYIPCGGTMRTRVETIKLGE